MSKLNLILKIAAFVYISEGFISLINQLFSMFGNSKPTFLAYFDYGILLYSFNFVIKLIFDYFGSNFLSSSVFLHAVLLILFGVLLLIKRRKILLFLFLILAIDIFFGLQAYLEGSYFAIPFGSIELPSVLINLFVAVLIFFSWREEGNLSKTRAGVTVK